MAEQTTNLQLYKYNKVTDAEEYVDIDDLVNDNWDKLDDFAGDVKDKVIELEDDIEANATEIDNIKAKNEEQDVQLQKLKTENQLLKSQFPTEVTEKSKSLTIKDGSNLPFKDIEISGDTEQETRDGKNKFNEAEFARLKSEYYEYTSETGLTLINLDSEISSIDPFFMPVEPNKTYFIKRVGGNVLNPPTITLYETNEDNSYLFTHTLNEDGSITTDSNASRLKVKISSNDAYPVNIGHIIISEQDVPYESYGVMPSLDYPSPIRGCGDNVQLFDKDSMLNGFIPVNGAYPTANSQYPNAKYKTITLRKGETYCISTPDGTITDGRIRYVDKESNTVVDSVYAQENVYYSSNSSQNNGIVSGKITAKKDFYIAVMFLNGTTEKRLKIEKGTKETPFSEFGEGNISIVKSNKNLAKFDENYFELTNNNRIKNIKGINSVKIIDSIKLKKGQTIKTRLKLISKNSVTFTAYKTSNGVSQELGVLNYVSLSNYDVNTNYDKSYTATEDCEIFYRAWGNSDGASFEFQFSISFDEFIDYIPHQEKTYIFPIAEPLRGFSNNTRDTLESDGIHKRIKKVLLNGTESWAVATEGNTTDGYSAWMSNLTDIKQGKTTILMCNSLKTIQQSEATSDKINFIAKGERKSCSN